MITQSTRLRTLTEKSKLGFGKNADLPIWKLLDHGSGKAYLCWVYYNASGITFTDEILDAINIRPDERIIKPGKNEELFNKTKKRLEKWRFSREGYKRVGRRKRSRKRKDTNHDISFRQSKSCLARLNHGHK